ncbi:MAG: RidA family protein [Bacteriovoracaceae bacterium]|jgi:2-iminobutanoate/2-iminopropanoate deaminase|nr:RidA family protein [Bacteriovoracaceae bacterium]
MAKNIIKTDLAPEAVGTYSQGVEVDGTFYFSGQIGLDPKTMTMKDDFQNQLDQIMSNIDGLLNSQDLTRKNIIKTSIFITDLANFGLVNEAYVKFFSEPYPARSCVQVPALPKKSLVEIEVIASRV